MHTAESYTQSLLSRISLDPEICHGKPVIRGLRSPVEAMLEHLSSGDSFDDMLAEFSDLAHDDLLACLEFAKLPLMSPGPSYKQAHAVSA
ncbi:MAG TPA: DUF433 domain-containing protein [Prosthecobacter sp.]